MVKVVINYLGLSLFRIKKSWLKVICQNHTNVWKKTRFTQKNFLFFVWKCLTKVRLSHKYILVFLSLIRVKKKLKNYFHIKNSCYRNTLYWDACIKTQVLRNRCSIKHAFWPFLNNGFNAASKIGTLGLNVAFNIEILINLIKI